MSDPVEVAVEGRVAVLTIRRPAARNAVNGDVARAMEAGIDRLEGDDELWAGIVTGEGPVFCAGADLKEIAAGHGADLMTQRGGFAGITRRSREKPLIAAVDGPALAGGCEIVLACDLAVASRQASFGLPEVKRSLVAAAGGPFRLPRALPLKVALEMVMTGDAISAERAYELGLVNRLVEPGEALAAAQELAGRTCEAAPVAVRASRWLALESLEAGDDENWRRTGEAASRVFGTQDFLEGPRAFIEKRPPRWQGR